LDAVSPLAVVDGFLASSSQQWKMWSGQVRSRPSFASRTTALTKLDRAAFRRAQVRKHASPRRRQLKRVAPSLLRRALPDRIDVHAVALAGSVATAVLSGGPRQKDADPIQRRLIKAIAAAVAVIGANDIKDACCIFGGGRARTEDERFRLL
jgi:hypothetical protein